MALVLQAVNQLEGRTDDSGGQMGAASGQGPTRRLSAPSGGAKTWDDDRSHRARPPANPNPARPHDPDNELR
jgi:hypothetical protein